jgi:hypothetical protein
MMMKIDNKPGWVRISCDGGCGRHVDLRLKKVVPHDFYLCGSKASGVQCQSHLPPKLPGQISAHELSAAASFTGITYRWPDPEQINAVRRARNNLVNGLTKMVIEKAARS